MGIACTLHIYPVIFLFYMTESIMFQIIKSILIIYSMFIVFFSRYPNLLDLLLAKLEECAAIIETPLIQTDIRSLLKAAQSVPYLYPIAILFTHLLPSSLEFIPAELSSKVTRFAPLLIRYQISFHFTVYIVYP